MLWGHERMWRLPLLALALLLSLVTGRAGRISFPSAVPQPAAADAVPPVEAFLARHLRPAAR
jgi:hypothetical protein